MKTVFWTAVTLPALAFLAILIVIYSGFIDVAATKPHYAITQWVLGTTLENSVKLRARGIIPPEGVGADSEAAHHYDEMCGLCHGAPGKDPSEIGQGLRPKPPDLAKVADHMSKPMVFWVAKNGIRMTGMPAFGKTHGDGELWKMVSFVKSLPGKSPKQYRIEVQNRNLAQFNKSMGKNRKEQPVLLLLARGAQSFFVTLDRQRD